jgi:prepilin-type processing-associated H-X9-DG protein
MRFRHMKNTTTPVAFFDGHVESRRVGDVKVREICINK